MAMLMIPFLFIVAVLTLGFGVLLNSAILVVGAFLGVLVLVMVCGLVEAFEPKDGA